MVKKVYAIATRRQDGEFVAAALEMARGAKPKSARGVTREEALGKALQRGRIYYGDFQTERDLLVAEARDETILIGLQGEYVAQP